MINLYKYVYYILTLVLNRYKESMQLLKVTKSFSYQVDAFTRPEARCSQCFRKEEKHFRPRVDIEIYLCISVQLGSLKFFFDLSLSIQDEGEVPKKPTEHRSSDEVLGK